MSGVILALIEHPETASHTLAATRHLAGLMGGARINALAVRVPPESTIMPTEEVLTRHHAADIRAGEQARVAALRAAYDAWAPRAGSATVTVHWADLEGLVESLVGEWGRRSDYLVLNRPLPRDNASGRLEMQAALFDTDRPVLVVPPGPPTPFGERVAIAWRDDKRTVRAVLAGLRLLSQAREVHVLTGVREGVPPPALPAMLAEHGIEATLHVLPVGPQIAPDARQGVGSVPFGATLLAEAHALGVDLLVMGAYTHSPWHELLLGGVTRYMLAQADLPVLMRH